ncbi:MAG: penicillin-binding protein, partial [Actinomycetota bacterium]|nr:penicillin-binding protein [Actinomycetota bacterium]
MTPPPHDRRSSYDEVLAHVAHKRRRRRGRERRSGRRSLLTGFGLTIVLGFFAVLAGGAVAGAIYVQDTLSGVSLDGLKADPPGINSRIYDREGNLVETISSTENRTPVPSNKISPWLKAATVAIEDRRFYEHQGVDYQGIFRATIDNLRAGSIQQGASTIEQQLVRNLYLSNEETFTRKIREAYLAMQMSQEWSKDRVLTEYLNIVPYGAVTYGCEAAALRYFAKHCSHLKIAEAALLAGLPQNPILLNPIANKQGAKSRRNEVLAAMRDTGALTQLQYDELVKRPLGIKRGGYLDRTAPDNGYFVAWVRQLMESDPQWGTNTVRKGGLQIHTTLDPQLQDAMHRVLTDTMSWTDAPAAAMVAMDPRTGEVLAMDASVPYSKNAQYNIPAEAYRQTGSTFKMFTLTAAIAAGYNPDTTYELSAHLEYLFPNTAIGPNNPWSVDTASDSEELNAP